MRTRLIAVVASLALTVVAVVPARAATVLFNPAGTGVGGALTIDLLDPGPGNSLSMGVNATSPVGTVGSLLFQANLGSADNTIAGVETIVFSNGAVVGGAARFFTVAASFNETITSNSGGLFPTLIFGPDGGATNGTFAIYAQGAAGSDLSGVCFVNCTGANAPILTGTALNNVNFFGNFTANLAAAVQPLDQFGIDNYPGVNTISGKGSFGLDITVTGVNAGYFPDIKVGQTLAFLSSENSLPFKQANPAACFSTDAVTSCNQVGVGSVGPVNQAGRNSILQTDANVSFGTQSPIPEPATLTLLGFGLVAVARRRQRNVKQ